MEYDLMTEKVNEELMESVIKQMKEDNIKFIRLQFVDINGTAKNIVIPFKEDDMAELFVEGMLFDGSSIAGFVGIKVTLFSNLISTLTQDYHGGLKNLQYVDLFVMSGLLTENHLLETQEVS